MLAMAVITFNRHSSYLPILKNVGQKDKLKNLLLFYRFKELQNFDLDLIIAYFAQRKSNENINA